MKNSFYIAIILGVIFTSCKKKIVEIPDSNEPIFTVSGTIGSDSVNFIVGDDNSVFSAYMSNYNGVDFYTGKLSNENTEIEIGLFAGDNDFQNIKLDSLLNLKNIDIAELASNTIFEIKKGQFSNQQNIKEIKWFVDGEYRGTNSLKITTPGRYNLCANITYNNLQTAEVCNEILVGFRRNTTFNLDFNINSNNQLSSWVEPSGVPITSINWYLNDNLIANAPQLVTTLSNEIQVLKAEINFSDGSKRTRSVIVDGTNNNLSIADFAQNENESNLQWDYKLKVIIKHLGNEYNSLFVENNESKLIVNNISFMGIDTKGNPVYIVKGLLTSKLLSKDTNEILDVKLNVSWGICIK
ncbi:MAG: hypothetical protein ACK5B9_08870 [Flavobacteriia bacterium]|jgi:hypothetical protein